MAPEVTTPSRPPNATAGARQAKKRKKVEDITCGEHEPMATHSEKVDQEMRTAEYEVRRTLYFTGCVTHLSNELCRHNNRDGRSCIVAKASQKRGRRRTYLQELALLMRSLRCWQDLVHTVHENDEISEFMLWRCDCPRRHPGKMLIPKWLRRSSKTAGFSITSAFREKFHRLRTIQVRSRFG